MIDLLRVKSDASHLDTGLDASHFIAYISCEAIRRTKMTRYPGPRHSRIENSSHITLCTDCDIVALEGKPGLQSVSWVNNKTGERTQRPIESAFVMIGAEPNTGWLYGTVRLDKKGFILTGGADGFESTPYATSAPGIYAVGDVRANSVKRVASAVGEGSVVISDIHRYLADHRNLLPVQPNSTLAALRSTNAAVQGSASS